MDYVAIRSADLPQFPTLELPGQPAFERAANEI